MDTLSDADADMAQDDEEETEQQVAQDPKTGQPLQHRLVSTEDTEDQNVDGEGDHWDESQEHENDNVDEEGYHSDAYQEHENHDATPVRETCRTGSTAFTIAAIYEAVERAIHAE
eukprot:2002643-Rhodomonas_salina.1